MNPDLQKERRSCSFRPDDLTVILYRGKEATQRKRHLEELVIKDEVFSEGPDYVFLSREEKYDRGVKNSVQYVKRVKELNLTDFQDALVFRSMAFPNENPPIALHMGMFLPALMSQCSPEQADIWLPKALNYDILGTYAQTEMGHGTHLRGLETTATYDPSREEFVINSPTLTSLKWWPGGLGKTSNHAVLMATLYTKGQKCGIQPFIIQIRDMQTHEPLPGVTVGDIGPKFGYDMIDNGFLGFKNVRIPRKQMLMKNAQVQKDGTFVATGKHSKLVYGTMVLTRAMIVSLVGAKGLAQAATIAIRYSCVRRQSELKPGAPEPQVIDYQTQQYKLFPLLASAYAFWFAGIEMRDIYDNINSQIERGNTDALPELHAISSALKAYTTDIGTFGIEICRLSCGGHGYSMASGLPKIYVNATPGCTYEGENTVLYLQTARFLLKAYSAARSGQPLSTTMAYLKDTYGTRSRFDRTMNLQTLTTDFKHRAARLVNKAGDKYSKLLASGHPDWEARNLCSVDLVIAAKAHSLQWIVDNFVKYITKQSCPPEVTKVLTTLCQIYAAYNITQCTGDFLLDNYMSASQIATAENCVLELLQEIRPNAVGLVDAFDFRDELLCSVLGRYDGNVYENLYKWAQNAPLNRKQVDDSFNKYIKPYREELQSKL